MLVEEVAQLVAEGKITEEEILLAITEIRQMTIPKPICLDEIPKIVPNDFEQFAKAPDQHTISPFTILARIDIYERLSEAAKTVIRLVLESNHVDSPEVFTLRENQQPRITRKSLTRAIRSRLGWPFRSIDKVFAEIKQFCQDIECV